MKLLFSVCWLRRVVSALLLVSAGVRAAEPVALPVNGLCAHRGGGATHPENTVPALREAVRLGAHMVEFDLAVTSDGVPVLMHDATVDRTTDGKGRVLDFTLAALQRLDAGVKTHPRFAGTRVPTLEEALAVLPANLWINVDFKADARFAGASNRYARRVAEVLVSTGRVGQSLFAARGSDVAAARSVAPALRICNMDRKPDPADYVNAAIEQRADFIQLRDCAHDPRWPAWIAALKAAGVRINYFYTNDPKEAVRLLDAGVDFVLVDALEAVMSHQDRVKPWTPR
ncbi:MAG: glycerophosphodiester phosphodiesterase family protein [Opitutaceae bacterium]